MVCVKCEVEFKVESNGVKVLEMMNHNQAIYKIWDTDKWRCPVCGVEVCAGFGSMPIAEHFEAEFDEVLADCKRSGDEIVYDKEVESAEHL
jgi:hypothetical protein